MRFFRTADESLYESVRLQLDAAWGLPNAQTKTATCIDPAAVAPRDTAGRIMLAVHDEWCGYEAVAAVLPSLLASGVVHEISEDEYRTSQPDPFAG